MQSDLQCAGNNAMRLAACLPTGDAVCQMGGTMGELDGSWVSCSADMSSTTWWGSGRLCPAGCSHEPIKNGMMDCISTIVQAEQRSGTAWPHVLRSRHQMTMQEHTGPRWGFSLMYLKHVKETCGGQGCGYGEKPKFLPQAMMNHLQKAWDFAQLPALWNQLQMLEAMGNKTLLGNRMAEQEKDWCVSDGMRN